MYILALNYLYKYSKENRLVPDSFVFIALNNLLGKGYFLLLFLTETSLLYFPPKMFEFLSTKMSSTTQDYISNGVIQVVSLNIKLIGTKIEKLNSEHKLFILIHVSK
jgi:hypothetical protein